MLTRQRHERRPGSGDTAGFTLVELMIVVAIIGILASIAIPAFSRYIKRSRTAEAFNQLNKMWAGSVSYYETDHMGATVPPTALPRQFPGPSTAAPTASTICAAFIGGKCANMAFFNAEPWRSLHLAMSDPYSYFPQYLQSGTGVASQFTANVYGDLDADGLYSTYQRVGQITSATGDVSGQMGASVTADLE